MKKSFAGSIFLAVAVFLMVAACKKEQETDYDTESSQDNAQAELIFNELSEISDQAVEDGHLTTHRSGTGEGNLLVCAAITLTLDSANGSGSATIDFGTSFCRGIDGKYRKGVIDVAFTGGYRDSSTVITISTSTYFVGYDSSNATRVTGTRTVTNRGRNTTGNLNYSVEVTGTLVNYLGNVMNWHSVRNREWIAGESTGIWLDDEYLITGSASGKSFAGVNFTVQITSALHVKLNCRWITKGSFSLTPENKASRVLDYGDGVCDNNATVTIGDKTYHITLR